MNLIVNRSKREILVKPEETLLDVLRNHLALDGARRGCDTGGCGCCTVFVDGRPIYSCMVLAASLDNHEVTSIEGLAHDGRLDPLQEAFVKVGAVQCGYCTSGMIMSAKFLLSTKPSPTEEEIRKAISGNLCRCTGYQKIIEAIRAASASNRH